MPNENALSDIQKEVNLNLEKTLNFSKYYLDSILRDENTFRLVILNDILIKIQQKIKGKKLHLFCFSVKSKDDFNLYELLKEQELNEKSILDLVDVIIERALEYQEIKKQHSDMILNSSVQYV